MPPVPTPLNPTSTPQNPPNPQQQTPNSHPPNPPNPPTSENLTGPGFAPGRHNNPEGKYIAHWKCHHCSWPNHYPKTITCGQMAPSCGHRYCKDCKVYGDVEAAFDAEEERDYRCQHKRCSLSCWPKLSDTQSEETGNHNNNTTAHDSEASTPADTDDPESEDSDADEEEVVDGYLLVTTLLSYDQLPHGHTIKKDTPYKACCKCDWCPNGDLSAIQCLDCDHVYCDGCIFVQYESDAEVEEQKGSEGGPKFDQAADDIAATEDVKVAKSWYDDADGEDFFPPLLNLNPGKPVSTHHHMNPEKPGTTPKAQAPFWECCQCGALKQAAHKKCENCTHPICHGCQGLNTADTLAKIEQRKKEGGKGSRRQADAEVGEKRESSRGESAVESAVMKDALKELSKAIHDLPMGTLIRATIEQKELDTLMWLTNSC
ncbi:MAG: hypothetical protein Q9208_005205 [Pyrenodesmia sp. 3 TL-2023]